MAATTVIQPMNSSKYYMDPQSGPSPPESYHNNSATPPSNISPTNYHASVRQLRQPRQPLYIPAALRPTDKPARPTDIPNRPRAPDTPPASQDSSFDSFRMDSAAPIDFAAGNMMSGQVENDAESLRRGLSRAASESYAEEEPGDVTGTPTTAHWKPDESSNVCFICNETFTWFFRRHHCRRCGNLVCDNHLKFSVPLDQNARYHPKGFASKACKPCFDGWKVVRKLQQHSRANSIAESSNSSQGTAMPIPNLPRADDNMRVGSMARSEGGMVWSTF
ncbi:FYVE-type zinc finger-containing [Lecanosticta acicola]|uniref:FYVE-type zinc finger-containing n=1 Tax=Lecanosticta acicola TaxID=111012 RepID=A0AAI9E7B8_9PEZI|nr:FYVE-type zinc finger-containing [Lecanosticta acicola]